MSLFVFRFYGPVNPLGSCQAHSVYLTTHFPGQVESSKWLASTCAHSFTRNRQKNVSLVFEIFQYWGTILKAKNLLPLVAYSFL